jgi:glycosyltransferase involved in cell wall biosynthesis
MQNDSLATVRLPIRLAFVITELGPGGAEQCLVELATRLDRSLFSPVVYSLGPLPNSERQSLVNRLAEAGIPSHFLGFTSPWQYFGAVRELTKLLREQQPDIVQTFLFHANVVGTAAARAAGVRHIVTGLRVADPRWWRAAVERAMTKSADRYICVSQSVAEFYRRRGFSAEKLVVIPNGIETLMWRDTKPKCLSEFGIPRGRRVLLFVGRLDKQKGMDLFFQELPTLFRDLPDHELLLVGDGPQATSLVRLARRLRVQERVHFLGWRADIPPIMAAADLLVLPSRWEGMPNVVLEAMAAGKPVIATQAEGTVELLGIAALEQTTPVGDGQRFRMRLTEITKDKLLAQDLGRRNQERAEQFSLEAVVTRYWRLYQSLLKAD